MSEILIGISPSGPVKLDLDVLLRTRMLIQANSGQGKSWLLRRIAEQMFGKMQIIIIDPEGEFATLRERHDFVLVGPGGETPADCRSAALLSHKLLELNVSAVCDLFEMKASDRHRWVRLFLEAMIDAPKKLWHPVAVIVDEAHTYVPEHGDSEASDAMISLATRGRKRGFAAIFATQRLAKLRKDAAAELQNVMIGGTTIDIDRKRAADSLGIYGSDQHRFFDEVKLLKPGQFFALGRAISNERIIVEVGNVSTSHPEAGSVKHSLEPPPPSDRIRSMLPKLADLPKTAEQKAATERELKVEVAKLSAKLRAAERGSRTAVDANVLDRLQSLQKENQTLRNDVSELRKRCASLSSSISMASKALGKAPDAGPEFKHSTTSSVPGYVQELVVDQNLDRDVREKRWMPKGAPLASSDQPKLREGARRMLAALLQFHPGKMTYGQLRSHAGLRKSGTYSAYLRDLRNAGLVEENGDGIRASDHAVEILPPAEAPPSNTDEVLSIWRPKLREGARRMLDVLVEYRGDGIGRQLLAERSGIVVSGTFSAYLRDLRTAGLATVDRDMVRANRETLLI